MKEIKFSTQHSDLLGALTKVVSIIPTRTVLASLENIELSLKGKTLSLSATDMDMFITTKIPVSTKSEGTFYLNGKLLFNTISVLNGEEVTFTVSDKQVNIQCGSNKTKMRHDGEQLPIVPELKPVATFGVDSSIFLGAMKTAVVSVNTSNQYDAMAGCLFSLADKKLTFVGTDARKLSAVTEIVDCSETLDVILPSKIASILSKSFTGNVTVSINETLFSVENENISFTCKTIDNNYPNWKAILPKDISCSVALNRTDFIESIKRVTALGFSQQTDSDFTITLSKDNLHLFSENVETLSNSEEDIKCDYEGAEFTICFNAAQMLPLLSSIDTDFIELRLAEGNKPNLIYPVGKDNITLLIMQKRSK